MLSHRDWFEGFVRVWLGVGALEAPGSPGEGADAGSRACSVDVDSSAWKLCDVENCLVGLDGEIL